MSQKNDMMRTRQLNPADELYWKSRGWDSRPADWQRRIATGDVLPNQRTDIVRFGLPDDDWYAPLDLTPSGPVVLGNSVGNMMGGFLGRVHQGDRNNPDHDAYWRARGWDSKPDRSEMNNPNNDAYWVIRGHSERPTDWRSRV